MKLYGFIVADDCIRRSPCGERGLKYAICEVMPMLLARSLPVRGAWVEIKKVEIVNLLSVKSLPVRGAWVEMRAKAFRFATDICRSPCGERGLKSECVPLLHLKRKSLPVRGAWVEIFRGLPPQARADGRSPCGERGLKFVDAQKAADKVEPVAPRAGSVG